MIRMADALLSLASHVGSRPILVLLGSDHGAERLALLAGQAFPNTPVFYCPATDALPGDAITASAANMGQRVAALHGVGAALSRGEAPLLIVGAEATVPLYPAPSAFKSEPPVLRRGQDVDLAAFREQLITLGYRADERIDEPGEVGEAGVVLDIFPVDSAVPVRVEVEFGAVRSIRHYDALNQASSEELERAAFGIAAEPPLGEDAVPLPQHIPGALWLVDPAFAKARARQLALQDELGGSNRMPVVDADDWSAEEARAVAIDTIAERAATPTFAGKRRATALFRDFLSVEADAGRRVIVAGSERDTRFFARRLAKALKTPEPPRFDALDDAMQADAPLALTTLPLDGGAVGDDVTLLAAADLLGSRAEGEHVLASVAGTDPLAVTLRLGDAVVHDRYGVGILRGLAPFDAPDGGASETITVEYAKGAMRQVPVIEAGKLWRYGGEGGAVKLDTLDGKSWEKRRAEIDASIVETARHLRKLAKERAKATAPELVADAAAYERFVDGFPYSETADQRRAFEAVRADLAAGKLMDRLVIGDVGFGKTEVALRAAAIAALAGRQVALVAPTTLLARQHFDEFTRRFKRVGIKVVSLSRASSAAEQKAARAALADGSAKVVVGTSAIAAKSTVFQDLALVIIDEEQRFGAAQKAKLEGLSEGHVLRLSATPIPRTLQSALVGLNSLSLLTTPPARRVPIQTALGDWDEEAVRAALLREHARRGQSFVVVPRIADLEGMQAFFAKQLPDFEVLTVHGKMASAEADEALIRFARGEGQVLLATSIIETGLDVPRANTMIIAGCDRFGVGQLHQLRGRVGRSSRRGHVLMLSAPGATLNDKTRARLNQLVAQSALGAGFAVAANDLDMRGAGDLTSDDQSGHLKLIGLELYQHLLTETLRHLNGEAERPPLPRIDCGGDALFPADWIVDSEARIAAYVRLARIAEPGDLDGFADELEDRYGVLPPAAVNLLATQRLALEASAAGIERIQVGPAAIALTARPGAKLKPANSARVSNDRILAPRDVAVDAVEDASNAIYELVEANSA